MKSPQLISQARIRRIKAQGYFHYSDEEVSAVSFGNRFAYILCVSVVVVGVITANIPTLFAMMTVALFGVVLPNHPFDYIYNFALSRRMNKPKVPPRSPQLKFACSLATLAIGTTIYFFDAGMATAGYIMGSSLIFIAGLVSTTDLCIPSEIFNFFFKKKEKEFA